MFNPRRLGSSYYRSGNPDTTPGPSSSPTTAATGTSKNPIRAISATPSLGTPAPTASTFSNQTQCPCGKTTAEGGYHAGMMCRSRPMLPPAPSNLPRSESPSPFSFGGEPSAGPQMRSSRSPSVIDLDEWAATNQTRRGVGGMTGNASLPTPQSERVSRFDSTDSGIHARPTGKQTVQNILGPLLNLNLDTSNLNSKFAHYDAAIARLERKSAQTEATLASLVTTTDQMTMDFDVIKGQTSLLQTKLQTLTQTLQTLEPGLHSSLQTHQRTTTQTLTQLQQAIQTLHTDFDECKASVSQITAIASHARDTAQQAKIEAASAMSGVWDVERRVGRVEGRIDGVERRVGVLKSMREGGREEYAVVEDKGKKRVRISEGDEKGGEGEFDQNERYFREKRVQLGGGVGDEGDVEMDERDGRVTPVPLFGTPIAVDTPVRSTPAVDDNPPVPTTPIRTTNTTTIETEPTATTATDATQTPVTPSKSFGSLSGVIGGVATGVVGAVSAVLYAAGPSPK
ncbi:hypothetical protein HK097_001456 [Rhizophlyctis rosea]|uniref:Uncharacterized protein n=1 Tax=Rhizophlyctis rosea TaxID=64517 RepID=A0AAD5S782_9FUNG|nr:hypothetical protein HK097_001456 [Rhizophlyctis rosea]